jgi:uncharacterized membrane protein
MTKIFQSLWQSLVSGLVLLVVLVLLSGSETQLNHAWGTFAMRWLHVACGVMWVGLLYYFNFVQMPSMPKIPDEQKPAVSKVIAPAALFWFRHAALATVVTGLLLAFMSGYLVNALSLERPVRAIGMGMWIALVMAFNVWFIIWPNCCTHRHDHIAHQHHALYTHAVHDGGSAKWWLVRLEFQVPVKSKLRCIG